MLMGMNVAIDEDALRNNRIDHGQEESEGEGEESPDPAMDLMQAGEDDWWGRTLKKEGLMLVFFVSFDDLPLDSL